VRFITAGLTGSSRGRKRDAAIRRGLPAPRARNNTGCTQA